MFFLVLVFLGRVCLIRVLFVTWVLDLPQLEVRARRGSGAPSREVF